MNSALPGKHLKCLLRDLSRGLYVNGKDEWTADPDEAKEYSSIAEAFGVMDANGIRDAEIVEHVGFTLSCAWGEAGCHASPE